MTFLHALTAFAGPAILLWMLVVVAVALVLAGFFILSATPAGPRRGAQRDSAITAVPSHRAGTISSRMESWGGRQLGGAGRPLLSFFGLNTTRKDGGGLCADRRRLAAVWRFAQAVILLACVIFISACAGAKTTADNLGNQLAYVRQNIDSEVAATYDANTGAYGGKLTLSRAAIPNQGTRRLSLEVKGQSQPDFKRPVATEKGVWF